MKKLKELRQNAKMTQQEVAELLKTSRVNYNRYELGISEPDIDRLKQMSKLFKVSVDTLIENTNEFTIDISNMHEVQQELIKDYVDTVKEASWSELMSMHNDMINQQIYNKEHPEVVKAKQEQREYERKANAAWVKRAQKQLKEDEE